MGQLVVDHGIGLTAANVAATTLLTAPAVAGQFFKLVGLHVGPVHGGKALRFGWAELFRSAFGPPR
jgi:hypothetical protein